MDANYNFTFGIYKYPVPASQSIKNETFYKKKNKLKRQTKAHTKRAHLIDKMMHIREYGQYLHLCSSSGAK